MKNFIYIFFFSILSNISLAQLWTNNNVNISIDFLTPLTIKGGMTSNGTSTINNNGEIFLTGDFVNNTNNNLFGSSLGYVILNGGFQKISGTTETAFNYLILAGTDNKQLQINTTVGGANFFPDGELQLNDKILFLNGNLLTITNGSEAAINRTTGYIESETGPPAYGQIKWRISEMPSGSVFIFPFGNALSNNYLPLQLEITNGGVGSDGSFTISTYSTASDNLPLPTGVTSIINLNGQNNADFVLDCFWIIEPADYSVLPTSSLTFTYRDVEHTQPSNTINESLLQMQYSNGTIWSPTPSGTVNTATNTILVNNVSDYAFAWTAVDKSSPLPIELLYFDATPVENKHVLCKWSTATEINNDFFTLQRSENGINFESIGSIKGAGNSNKMLRYEFTDYNPYKNVSYYRLKQTDFDGSFSYSDIVAVNLKNNHQTGFHVHPNPASGIVHIEYRSETDNAELIVITDLQGRTVKTLDIKGAFEFHGSIDISGFDNGIYFINITGNNSVIKTAKLVKVE